LGIQPKGETYLPSPASLTGTPAAGSYYNNSSITLTAPFSFAAASGSSLKLYIVNPDCVPLASLPSATQNYIVTSVPRVGGITDASGFANRSTCELMQTVQYFDGLGRPLQTVQVKGSTGLKDMVQPVAYDAFGREATKYLPYASPTSDGSYKANAISSELSSFYYPNSGTTSGAQQTGNGLVVNPNPYSLTNFEPSPLNRVAEQGAPGTPWQPIAGNTTGHTVKMAYGTNNATALTDVNNSFIAILYNAVINSDQSRTLTVGNSAGTTYPAGQLNVTISYDENWTSGKPASMEEYKDKEGHVVLKRTFNLVGTTVEVLSTYYVYDDLGNLSFVVPPMSGGDGGITSAANPTALTNYCYQYQYDQRNRLVQKKLPGKDWEYMVYNKLDQVVATQDGLQRGKATQEWTFTKYDGLGRVAYWGIYQYPSSTAGTSYRAALQTTMDNEAATILWETAQTTGTGYNGIAWPHANITRYLQLNYYDNYTFPGNPYVATVSGTIPNPTGLQTASKTAVLLPDGTYGSMLWSVSYYDGKGQLIQGHKQHYLGGEASVNTNNYDEVDNGYDFTGALTQSIRHHYVAGAQALVTSTGYTYDHMGRKLQTSEAIASGTNALPAPTLLSQSDYNEIGQVKMKHLQSATGSAPFMQDISYAYNERGWLQQSTAPLFAMQLKYNDGTTPQFNGNIANQLWGTPGSLSKNYAYSYDKLNRLTAGVSNEGYSEQNIDYDLNGNIKHLTRQTNAAYTYAYSGNQVQTVSGVTTGTYTYDLNGNVKFDAHTGKTTTVYNLLNLPGTVTATGFNLTYTYDATGQKIRKNNGTTTTDYIGGIQYENGAIVFVQTEEGRALKSGTNYVYEYSLGDHLGNTRVSFDQNSATAIKQQDDYYPFGMEITRGPVVSPKNYYLYNKKELQTETGLYDYGARFYDPVIGRWTTIDPLAEKSRRWSPYVYGKNNPIIMVDPDGMFDVHINGSESQAATDELQKSVKGQLDISRDTKTGNITYTQVAGAKLDANATQLKNAIDDHSVTVNVKASSNVKTSEGTVLAGGAFMGNRVTPASTPGGTPTVVANQEVNPSQLKTQSDYYGKPGADILHEVTEAYQGAKISQASGLSSRSSMGAGSIYSTAHDMATPQSGMQYIDTQDSNGESVKRQVPGGNIVYFVQEGNRPPAIILIYPIPTHK
jgi:RHS repeat-associated protein